MSTATNGARRTIDAMLELGVQLNHAAKSDAPNLANLDVAMRNVLREIPTARRTRASFYIMRATVRQLMRDFILENERE